MRKRRIILALFLILLGVYFLLQELGASFPGWDQVWPAFLFAGGLASLIEHFSGQRGNPERVFFGIAATLVGLAFLVITIGPLTYSDLETWWPVFVVIGGLAFLGQWLAAGLRDWNALFLALTALLGGVAGLAITLEWLGPETRQLLPRLWPVLLIAAGVMALLRGLVGKRSS